MGSLNRPTAVNPEFLPGAYGVELEDGWPGDVPQQPVMMLLV